MTHAVPSALGPVACIVDAALADVSQQYRFLLTVTPVNGAEAWAAFEASGTVLPPVYRPLPETLDALRAMLDTLPVDDVEDADVRRLLTAKRDEMAAHLAMLSARGTPAFRDGSLALYGRPDGALVALARALASRTDAAPAGAVLGPEAFAEAVREEVAFYVREAARAGVEVDVPVEIRPGLVGNVMVSGGRVLVGTGAAVPAARRVALLAHEVGTHVLTALNGRQQPLGVFAGGLAGYEALQEGLAVLAEWLVGGLTAGRIATLAARVLAADALVRGADFGETHRLLVAEAGLDARAAFDVALRVHRGGGLTKDLIYLDGLRALLAHLARPDADYDALFAGKIGLADVPAVRRLTARGVLVAPLLFPRHLSDADAVARLARVRAGLTVADLVDADA